MEGVAMSAKNIVLLFAASFLVFISSGVEAATSAVSAGLYDTLALASDGTLRSWGQNTYGQLGDATVTSVQTPVEVANLFGVTAIATGSNHNLALKGDGTVWAWGDNTFGQLGDGTNTQRMTPVQVGGLSGITAIYAGANSSYALKSDGTLWGWGNNAYGQLGDGTKANQIAPVRAQLTGVVAIASGNNHVLALKTDGTIWAWGHNQYGQVGDGTQVDKLFPVRIDPYLTVGITGMTAVSARADSSYAIRSDGTAWSWGNNADAQLGLGQSNMPAYASTPVQIPGLASVQSIAAGNSHAVALKKDGTVWAWGSNSNGQTGMGTPGNPSWAYSPSQVAGLSGVIQVSAGGASTVVLKSDYSLYAFGGNMYGQIGNGMMINTATPSQVIASGGTGFLYLNLSATPQTGWWWNPAESGRGFMVEVRGGNMFFGGYLYDTTGRATWYVSTGAMSSTSVYQGALLSFANGQTLTGAYQSNTSLPSPGSITIQFSDASHGLITWPGGTIPIQRFNIVPNGLSASSAAFQPEAGWWWNPNESGRGFALEIQGGTLFMAGYMYDASGNPIWYSSLNALTNQQLYQGEWGQYGNGQTLTGTYHAASVVNSNVGTVALQFIDAADALLTLPDGRQITITRFRF